MTTPSSDVADEEQFLFTQADSENESEEETFEKKTTPARRTFWVAEEEPSSLRTGVKELKKRLVNTTLYSVNGIKANARIRVEQDVDLTLKNLKLEILGRPYEERLLTTGRRDKHYKANEDRIILRYDRLFRKRYGKTGSVKYYHVLIPKHLVDQVLKILHGEFSGLLGITRTKMAYKEMYYHPNMAELIRKLVTRLSDASRNHK